MEPSEVQKPQKRRKTINNPKSGTPCGKQECALWCGHPVEYKNMHFNAGYHPVEKKNIYLYL